jgi:hypothetical protein
MTMLPHYTQCSAASPGHRAVLLVSYRKVLCERVYSRSSMMVALCVNSLSEQGVVIGSKGF